MTDTAEGPKVGRSGRGWRILRRLGLGMLVLCLVLGLGLVVLAQVMLGRTIAAPDWVRERLEGQAGLTIAGADLEFGGLEFVMLEGWKPRARLTDVQVVSASGQEIAAFTQLDAALSFDALMNRTVKPQSLSLAGAFATLRRGRDGTFSLSGGYDLSGPTRQAANLAGLVEGLDALLDTPGLQELVEADLQALTLRYEDALTGRAWTVDGGRARLVRRGDELTLSADLALLSGAADIATLELNYASEIGSSVAEFGVTVSDVDAADIALQSPALGWLAGLRAPISGSLRSGADAEGNLTPLNASLSIGEGVLQPTDETRPIPFESARAYFSYDPIEQALKFDELSLQSAWATGRAEGTAWLSGLESGQLESLVAQLSLDQFALNPNGLYPEPISVQRADADLRLTLDPFEIELGQAALQLGERSIILRGDLLADAEGWNYSLDAQVDELTPSEVTAYWPERFAAPTRKWVVENVLGGTLRAVDVALRGAAGAPTDSYLSFDFTEADALFMKTMPPIRGAQGHATLLENSMVVAVEGGRVDAPEGGSVDIAGSSLIIPDVRRKGEPAQIRLQTESSLLAAMTMIDLPPLEVLKKAGLAADIAEGQASLEGDIDVVLRKSARADYKVTGILSDVSSSKLIDGRRLRSPLLLVEASPAEVIIGGAGTLDGVPFEAAWRQEVGTGAPSTVSGTLTISEAALQQFNIGLPPGTVRGEGPGDVSITLRRDEPPAFSLDSSLGGIGLSIPAVGWSMGRNATGRLSLSGTLGDTPRVDRLELSGPGLSASGRVTLNPGGGLAEARFDRVRLGDWLDAPVSLVGRGRNAPPAVRVSRGSIDLRRANLGSGSGGSAMPLSMALDRLQITDTIALTNFRGDFTARAGLDGRFNGQINGGPAVQGRVVPQRGRTAVQITSDNAGGVVAAAGFLSQAHGGDLSLTLAPVGEEGVFDGFLKIKQTRVKKAPVMADLLSALSIVGLLEQLSGNGIVFTDVDATFRMTPQQVILRRASAVGPSLGISMDGTYGVAQKALNMQGVVSPVYFLNGIGSLFTRRGEGLIGFNYRLQGTAASPKVQVNPLSGLTPGFFREIFRAPPPKVEGDGSITVPESFVAPKAKEPRQRQRFLSGGDR